MSTNDLKVRLARLRCRSCNAGWPTDSDTASADRDRHCGYFVALCIEMMADCTRGSGIGLYPRFEAESGNFELASKWCPETDPASGLRLAVSYCMISQTAAPSGDAWRRGRLRLQEFLARTAASAPWRAWALSQFTTLPVADLALPQRRELLAQAVAVVRNDKDMDARTQLVVELTCVTKLGLTLIEMGDADGGARMVESALASARLGRRVRAGVVPDESFLARRCRRRKPRKRMRGGLPKIGQPGGNRTRVA
jgi:hypothetical protein